MAIGLGIVLILAGIAWWLLATFASMMASRSVSNWEAYGRPAMGVIPVALGILLIVLR